MPVRSPVLISGQLTHTYANGLCMHPLHVTVQCDYNSIQYADYYIMIFLSFLSFIGAGSNPNTRQGSVQLFSERPYSTLWSLWTLGTGDASST